MPSAAVTVTLSSFSPTIRFEPPKISNVASGFSVSTTTSTELTPESVSKVSPSTTSEPLIVKVSSSVLVLCGTTKITWKSAKVSPSAAVTVTVKTFSPTTSSSAPKISKEASASVVSTVTSTSVVSSASSTTSPSETSLPSTWNTAVVVSVPSRTFKITTYSEVVTSSSAVTVTTKKFSPATRPESPSTTKVARGSAVSTTTSTSVVPVSRSTESP